MMRPMKLRRLVSLIGIGGVAVAVPLVASSQQPAPSAGPVRVDDFYKLREAKAPPAVRAELQRERAAAARAGHDTEYGFTEVSDFKDAELANAVAPSLGEMQAHNKAHAAEITKALAANKARLAQAKPA